MSHPVYRFRQFRLDPRARELRENDARVALPVSVFDCLVYLVEHSDRPVGRDELIAAVWGRAEVSETLLGHTIVRLRRVFGDDGNTQHSIRTVARLGYHWIVPTDIGDGASAPVNLATEHDVDAPHIGAAEGATDGVPAIARSVRPHSPRRLFGLAASSAVVLAAVFGYVELRHSPSGAPRANASAVDADAAKAALVLPAIVDASGDWSWLRFGLMDLVANRLRRGNLATAPSETVVSLLGAQTDSAAASDFLDDPRAKAFARLRVQPRVRRDGNLWWVRLDVVDGSRPLQAEAQGSDVLAVGRAAADDLLVKLGHVPPKRSVDEPAQALQDLLDRTRAATLAGRIDIARTLLAEAPAELRQTLDVDWTLGLIDASAGDYDGARHRFESLLERVSAENRPLLRARTLNSLGALNIRRGAFDAAGTNYADGIALLRDGSDPALLGKLYEGLGLVAAMQLRFDDASADLGRARVLDESSGNAIATAQVDLNFGLIAIIRRKPEIALPILRKAAERFKLLSVEESWAAAMNGIVEADLDVLDVADALAMTDRFWPTGKHTKNVRMGWTLGLMRARALAANGRLGEAATIADDVRTAATSANDAGTLAAANAGLAEVADLRGDHASAARLAEQAMTANLNALDRDTYRRVGLIRIKALRDLGEIAEAGAQTEALKKWLLHTPGAENTICAEFALAGQADAQGHRAAALEDYESAWTQAQEHATPALLVTIGAAYAHALIAADRLDAAAAIAGRLAPWADRDLDAAALQASLFRALDRVDAWQKAAAAATSLAGERVVPDDSARSSRPRIP